MTTLRTPQPEEVTLQPTMPSAGASGARSGAILAAASGAGIVLNYAFLLAAGRILGSDRYGSLAALLGLLAVVLIPAGAVQMAVSREISRLDAAGGKAEADAFARATLRLSLLATAPLVVVALALAVPLGHLLHIHSSGIVALTELAFLASLLSPAATGVLQGRQRFHALAVLYVFPFVLRLSLLAILTLLGFRLGGTVFATVGATVGSALLAVLLIADSLRAKKRTRRVDLRPFLRYLAPVGVGLIAIALLTHVDILIVKARFSAHDAGAYAAASAFARVAFFLPATILTVLFPRTAARHARGEDTEDILGRSLLATIVFCAGLAVFYAATGPGLVTATFGRDFAAGGKVLAPFSVAIALFSLAQILVGYHLSRGETKYAWIVAGGVLVQMATLAVVPSTLGGVVWTNVLVGVALLTAHELFVGSSWPALRAGLSRGRNVGVRIRAAIPEAAAVSAGATVFTCVLFWPIVRHLSSAIVGSLGQDSTGTVAFLWSQGHETGYHVLGITHHTLTGAPFGWDESNAINVQVSLAYYPAYLIGHIVGYIAAYNLVTLAGYILSAVAMYYLARYLGCSRTVASWAAMVFVVFPYHLAHDQHASLLHLEVLAALVITLIATALRPTLFRFSLVGIVTLAAWLMSGYFGPMAVVSTIAFTIGVALVSRTRANLRLVVGSTLAALLATGIVGIDAVASGTNSGAGLGRTTGDLSVFGMRPTDLVVPPSGNLVLGDRLQSFWLTREHGSNPTEVANYVGLLTLALVVAWLTLAVRSWRTLETKLRYATAGLSAALVAGLLFAAPSPILIAGHKIWTPARFMFELVPAFRVLSRWDFLLMTVLVPLAALALEAGRRGLVRRGHPSVAIAVIAAAAAFSFAELTTHPWKGSFRTVPTPPEYKAMSETPSGILAEYPLGYSDIYRLRQLSYDRPLLNGAPPNTLADQARLVLLDPTQRGTAQQLALLGVTTIAVHPHAVVDAEVRPGQPTLAEGYRLVGRFADGASLWDVVAQAEPAFVTLPAGFSTPIRNGTFVGYPFTAPAGVGAIDLRTQAPQVVRLVFDVRPPKGVRREVRLGDAGHEQAFDISRPTQISVLVSLPRGASRLLLKIKPPATSAADSFLFSAPYTEKATGQPVVNAMPISPSPGF